MYFAFFMGEARKKSFKSILMNLAPRKIRGVESQGMILMAEDTEGTLAFVTPEKEIEAGSEIR